RLTAQNWFEGMGERPVRDRWGVGGRISQQLAGLDDHTVHDVVTADDARLVAEFGPSTGLWIGELGRGGGSAAVDHTPWVPRAHGRETTYQQDLVEVSEVEGALHVLPEQVVADLRADGRPFLRVHLKVRFAPFFTFNRSRKLPEPTWDPDAVARTALDLL